MARSVSVAVNALVLSATVFAWAHGAAPFVRAGEPDDSVILMAPYDRAWTEGTALADRSTGMLAAVATVIATDPESVQARAGLGSHHTLGMEANAIDYEIHLSSAFADEPRWNHFYAFATHADCACCYGSTFFAQPWPNTSPAFRFRLLNQEGGTVPAGDIEVGVVVSAEAYVSPPHCSFESFLELRCVWSDLSPESDVQSALTQVAFIEGSVEGTAHS